MTLLEHFKDPNFWDIFFFDLSIGLGLVAILVVIFWLLDKLQNKKPDLNNKVKCSEAMAKEV